MKNYLKKNFVSFLIGCVIGLPVSIYAVNHQEPATIPVYYDPGLFEQFSVESEQPEPTEPGEIIETCEMTAEELEEELFYDSLELLALCVESEAGNQGLYGKKLFSVVLDGRIWTVEPSEETFEAIREELEVRTNTEIIFFTSEGYSPYGEPWGKVGDHYFSTERR